ncbi:MAG: serine/threonine protein phosphatase [Dysosmobacter sp.]
MALYAIGDLHLSLGADKSMEVFGEPGRTMWADRGRPLGQLNADDVLVLAGDTSWGIDLGRGGGGLPLSGPVSLQEVSRQGKPRLLVGHRLQDEGLLCRKKASPRWISCTTTASSTGTTPSAAPGAGFWRGGKAHNAKVLNREVGRLETSLQAAGERPIWCFLHYPPLYQGYECPEILAAFGTVPGGAVLLRPSPRPDHPPEDGGKAGNGLFPDLGGLSGLCPTEKNL